MQKRRGGAWGLASTPRTKFANRLMYRPRSALPALTGRNAQGRVRAPRESGDEPDAQAAATRDASGPGFLIKHPLRQTSHSGATRTVSMASGSYAYTTLFRAVRLSLIGQSVVPFSKDLQITAR